MDDLRGVGPDRRGPEEAGLSRGETEMELSEEMAGDVDVGLGVMENGDMILLDWPVPRCGARLRRRPWTIKGSLSSALSLAPDEAVRAERPVIFGTAPAEVREVREGGVILLRRGTSSERASGSSTSTASGEASRAGRASDILGGVDGEVVWEGRRVWLRGWRRSYIQMS